MRIDSGPETIFAMQAARQAMVSASAKPAAQALTTATDASTASKVTAPAAGTTDFTHLTPGEMQQVAHDLWKAGEIDITQLFMLQNAGVPLLKVGPDGTAEPLSAAERAAFQNAPVNYLEIIQNAMQAIEQSGAAADPTSGYAQWKGLYSTLSGQQAGIDVVA